MRFWRIDLRFLAGKRLPAGARGRVVVISAGPDCRFDTADDLSRSGNFRPLRD